MGIFFPTKYEIYSVISRHTRSGTLHRIRNCIAIDRFVSDGIMAKNYFSPGVFKLRCFSWVACL
jgi:hypothetical protein